MSLNRNMLRSLAGYFKSRAVRLITSIGVRVYYRELGSLRYQSILHTEQQDLIEHGKSGSFAELPTFAAVVEHH
jgi:hypothetical protein